MKIVLTLFLLGAIGYTQELNFDLYLKSFDYQERKDMKIKAVELLNYIEEGSVQVIDIRFPEEYASWRMGFGINIPLNELPSRLKELDKTKLIVTMCPHNDRASLARHYLTLKGYNARYLSDGMLKMVDFLRGDNAREFIEELKANR